MLLTEQIKHPELFKISDFEKAKTKIKENPRQ